MNTVHTITKLLFFVTALNASAASERCDQNLKKLLLCLSERAPSALRGRALAHEGQVLGRVAREWRPGELSIEALKARANSTAGDSLLAKSLFSVDMVGVRKARQRAAEMESSERQLDSSLSTQNTLLDGYLALVRIQLLRQEMRLLTETEKSLDKNLQEYRRRHQLSADQDASKTIFMLALQGLRQQRVLEEQETHGLVHDLETQIDETLNPSDANLPHLPEKWVSLKESSISPSALDIQKINLLKSKAEALATLSRKEKKPVLALGPSVEFNEFAGQSSYRIGLNLQAPLNLFNDFSGTAELAERSMARAATEASTRQRELTGEIEHAKEVYLSATAALKESEPPTKTWERIASVNTLFTRGLVPGSTVVEAMRQAMSSLQTHNELTYRAVQAFCKVRIAENKAEECWQ